MGQKINPRIFRIGGNKTWSSGWFSRGPEFKVYLEEDHKIRKIIRAKFKEGGIGGIEIVRRAEKNVEAIVSVARPGVVIGRGGQKAEEVKQEIKKNALTTSTEIQLTIRELKKPNLNADVVVSNMAGEIERRLPYRRVMKFAIDQVMKDGAQGVRLQIGGRLNGADIARTETLSQGNMPLHTLRADISYGRGVAQTTYGVIGIKVWVYKGELFGNEKQEDTVQKNK